MIGKHREECLYVLIEGALFDDEGEIHSSFILLFTDLDNDQTKEEQDQILAVSSDAARPYKD